MWCVLRELRSAVSHSLGSSRALTALRDSAARCCDVTPAVSCRGTAAAVVTGLQRFAEIVAAPVTKPHVSLAIHPAIIDVTILRVHPHLPL